eukprot:gene20642-1105_t
MPLHQGKRILEGLTIQSWTMSNDLGLFKEHLRKVITTLRLRGHQSEILRNSWRNWTTEGLYAHAGIKTNLNKWFDYVIRNPEEQKKPNITQGTEKIKEEEAALCGLYAIRYALEYHGFKETIERATLDTIAEGQQRIFNEAFEVNVTVIDSAPQALDANTVPSTTVPSPNDIDVNDFEEEAPDISTLQAPEAEQVTTTPRKNGEMNVDEIEVEATNKETITTKVIPTNPIAIDDTKWK